MDKKYNIRLIVPSLYKVYDIFIPINKTIGETILIISKGLKELTKNSFEYNTLHLYNSFDGEEYELNKFIYETNIDNGSELILC